MNLLEAMKTRHTVRKYMDKPIPEDLIQSLNNRIRTINQQNDLNIRLITEQTDGLNTLSFIVGPKNVKNYLILSADQLSPNKKQLLGYYSGELMLLAQCLGLNSWWIGGMFNKNIQKYVDGYEVVGIVALGYGENQGKQHKSKKYDEVALYKGEPPKWFKDGVEGALYAPTAINRQSFIVYGVEDIVTIAYHKSSFMDVDLGLVKYHFELAAGKENFKFKDNDYKQQSVFDQIGSAVESLNDLTK